MSVPPDSRATDKAALHAELVEALEREHASAVAAQKITSQGVTHQDARQEGDKDMRATEASYLARGQAERAAALEADLARARALPLRSFADDAPIGLTALVTLVDEDTGTVRRVLVAPAGGGITLRGDVHVVTPASPLGRALIGATLGQIVEVERAAKLSELEITALE